MTIMATHDPDAPVPCPAEFRNTIDSSSFEALQDFSVLSTLTALY